MFEQFTPPARQVIERATTEADRLRHNYVGAEHVLAALAADDGAAGRILREHGLSLETVRHELDRMVDRGTLPGPRHDDIELLHALGVDLEAVYRAVSETFGAAAVEQTARRVARRRTGGTPRWGARPFGRKGMAAKRALEFARSEAAQRHHSGIGPEHILLGLLQDAQSPPKVARRYRLPRSRQFRTHHGLPEPDRPSPITAVLASRELTLSTLRQAVLAELNTTA